MTRHELESRYQLLRAYGGDATNTYLARSRSGSIVMVHFLEDSPLRWANGRLGRLDSLDPSKRERILEVVEMEDGGAVVTRFLMDFTSFEAWIGADSGSGGSIPAAERRAGETSPGNAGSVPISGASAPSDVVLGTGEPTRSTSDGAAPGDAVAATELPPTLGSFPAVVPGSAADPGGGELTRLFRAQETSASPADPVTSPAHLDALHPAEPGEFTRMFRAQAAEDAGRSGTPEEPAPSPREAEEDPPASPSAQGADTTDRRSAPGEFTRMFRAQTPEGVTPPAAQPTAATDTVGMESAAQSGASDPPASGPGEFTRMFRAPPHPGDPSEAAPPAAGAGNTAASSPPPAPEATSVPVPPREQPGEFTLAFRAVPPVAKDLGPSLAAFDAAPDAPAPPPVSSTKPPAAGEFTRMFQKLGATPPPATPAPPTSTPPPLWPQESTGSEERYRERLFGGAATPARPSSLTPQPPAASSPPPTVPVDPELPPLPAYMVPPPPPPPPAGGEYTRMISAYAHPPQAARPETAAPAAAPGAQIPAAVAKAASRRLPKIGLLIGLGSIGLGTLGLILYLVLKSAMAPPGQVETPPDSVLAPAPVPETSP